MVKESKWKGKGERKFEGGRRWRWEDRRMGLEFGDGYNFRNNEQHFLFHMRYKDGKPGHDGLIR